MKRALGLAHGGIKLGRQILLFGCSLIYFLQDSLPLCHFHKSSGCKIRTLSVNPTLGQAGPGTDIIISIYRGSESGVVSTQMDLGHKSGGTPGNWRGHYERMASR